MVSASDDNIRLQIVLSGTGVLLNTAQKFKTYKSEENISSNIVSVAEPGTCHTVRKFLSLQKQIFDNIYTYFYKTCNYILD
jgi:hypothetical protein